MGQVPTMRYPLSRCTVFPSAEDAHLREDARQRACYRHDLANLRRPSSASSAYFFSALLSVDMFPRILYIFGGAVVGGPCVRPSGSIARWISWQFLPLLVSAYFTALFFP